jgi:hypothetical protein
MGKSKRPQLSADEQRVLEQLQVRLVTSPQEKALGRDLPEFRRAQSTRLEAGFYGRQGCLPLREPAQPIPPTPITGSADAAHVATPHR